MNTDNYRSKRISDTKTFSKYLTGKFVNPYLVKLVWIDGIGSHMRPLCDLNMNGRKTGHHKLSPYCEIDPLQRDAT
jgi:hypothetical protein